MTEKLDGTSFTAFLRAPHVENADTQKALDVIALVLARA